MESLSKIVIPIYQKLGNQYVNLLERREATKQYILTEITQWGVKELKQEKNYFYKPIEFKGNENSTPFEVRLIFDISTGYHELKFGNLNAPTDEERFKWDLNDPYKLQKSLFLIKILENKIIPLIKNKEIKGIEFTPYDKDSLGDDRYSYFYNMFSKLNKDKEYSLVNKNNSYFIYKK